MKQDYQNVDNWSRVTDIWGFILCTILSIVWTVENFYNRMLKQSNQCFIFFLDETWFAIFH